MNRIDFIKTMGGTILTGIGVKGLAKAAEDWGDTPKMPAFFVGHGNPMNAILENDITMGWRLMSKGMHPKAIMCISAHWETKGTKVTMVERPKTIHDFGGFPKALFDMQYPAPGSPNIAQSVIDKIQYRTVEEDHEWGLDHGTWSVLVKMFPEANVPVFQLSLDYRMSLAEHFELAKELDFLRKKGVLIIGSGNIVHNLPYAKWNSDEPYDWAIEFDQKIKNSIDQRDINSLIQINKYGMSAKMSVPTMEHYLPMLYIAALLQESNQVHYFNESIEMGSMSMRSFIIS
ncbi:4,5-DOPA-extradiol-dioxygenase [Reichenbachiella versicolor]|uniref:4,5-DOPA-extradiol-dioxygenase n=1 Tax=Reichenbachiella versicolor TaxID=1821036 RepID=UPI001FE7301D|nr:4,5-DOPA dioxygenase extradiol [Reichenbachiella versicolor]